MYLSAWIFLINLLNISIFAQPIPRLFICLAVIISVPKVEPDATIALNILSRCCRFNFFESFSSILYFLNFEFNITPAATSGPAKAPLPASSNPQMIMITV